SADLPAGTGRDLDRRILRCAPPLARRVGDHADRRGAVGDRHGARLRGDMDRLREPARGRCAMKRPILAIAPALAAVALLAACNQSAPDLDQYGASPELPEQDRGLLPNMTIARPARWGDRVPTVPQGYSISAIATGLGIPRQTLVLPNGDILVAEGRGGNAGK